MPCWASTCEFVRTLTDLRSGIGLDVCMFCLRCAALAVIGADHRSPAWRIAGIINFTIVSRRDLKRC